jgi:MOSC domain-containing protein YiiM
MTPALQLVSVNVGTVQPLRVDGRRLMSAIGKSAVAGPVAAGRMGLAADEQADLSVHGGLDKAVYAWPAEHYPWWQAQRRERGVSLFDDAMPPGHAGENLTLQGLAEPQVWVGDELHFDDCVLRVTQPREPCSKFNAVMGYPQAAKDMVTSGRSGWYLAVVRAGTLQAGQRFELHPGPRHLNVAQALWAKRSKHLR